MATTTMMVVDFMLTAGKLLELRLVKPERLWRIQVMKQL